MSEPETHEHKFTTLRVGMWTGMIPTGPDNLGGDPDERRGADGYEWFNVYDANGGYGWPKYGEPFHCPRCKTTRLECFPSGPYETAVRCPDCKVWTIVHDG